MRAQQSSNLQLLFKTLSSLFMMCQDVQITGMCLWFPAEVEYSCWNKVSTLWNQFCAFTGDSEVSLWSYSHIILHQPMHLNTVHSDKLTLIRHVDLVLKSADDSDHSDWLKEINRETEEHKKVRWAHTNTPCWFAAPHAGAERTCSSAVSFSLVRAFRSVQPHYESWHGRWSLSVWLVSHSVCDIDHWGHRLDLSTFEFEYVNQVGSFIWKFVHNFLSFFLPRQRQAPGLWWGLCGCQYCRARRGGRSSWVQHVAAQLPVSLPWPDAVGEDSAVWWRLVPATVHGPGGVPDRERDGDAQQWAQFHEGPDPISGKSDRQQTCVQFTDLLATHQK